MVSRIKRYTDDFAYIFREEGLPSAIFKTFKTIYGKFYLKCQRMKKVNDADNSLFDVMFVNGCGPAVPHPTRYRVDHQMEQLRAAGYSTVRVESPDFCKESLRHARTIVIFRCPITDQIKETIKIAKQLNKRVIYDVDDLVIDTKYTDPIPFLATMTPQEKAEYDDGVVRMGETLKMCDAAITSTEALADELRNYVDRVYINRNTASEEMYARSEYEIFKRDKLPYLPNNEVKFLEKKSRKLALERIWDKELNHTITLGYFSGSITHNDDFELIKPAVIEVMSSHKNVKLLLTGEIDVPDDLKQFESRISFVPFCEWKRLPHLIAKCDINLAPLVESTFNRAKSENKWTEASLLKVPTIASNVGAFAKMIKHCETGILCSTVQEWSEELTRLVEDSEFRTSIANNAYEFCKKNCVTIEACASIAEIIEKEKVTNYVFILPNFNQFGGTLVAFKHASILQKHGFDVSLVGYNDNKEWIDFDGRELPCIDRKVKFGYMDAVPFNCDIDVGIATFWDTLDFLKRYPKIGEIKYLVQGYEIDFCEPGVPVRENASETYFSHYRNVDYLTISKWCQSWLEEKYDLISKYAPNGIDCSDFFPQKRNFNANKVRVLIEGDCSSEQKNIDEAFRIASHLDPARFEVWYMTNTGKTKPFYRIDKMLGSVPHDRVSDIMRECHVLIKTSKNESFSYPPLEMMATGGLVLVLKNPGNAEYVKDGYNCIAYELGDDVGAAKKLLYTLVDDALLDRLIANGIESATSYNWKIIESDILRLYL